MEAITPSELEDKLQAKWQCFYDLSSLLTEMLSSDVLVTGISDVRSDAVIPDKYLNEVQEIKHRLFLFGGKFRSRTKRKNNLKEICDLWRRIGEEIVQQLPGKQSIEMKIKRITVGRYSNNKRIQKNTYSYNWINKPSPISYEI